ncbi:D-alanyl-D-alanine carboxypeptidase/D-alanyl-D-alanine-endopeptidase [Noviherbaspirillum cavernae]|uniref:D-alanyl-D-alanine carboxypeptidase/D-alanyl-D-alanine-endopeptidase n=1 Tax=Noviherbaspirillum cavernae TaxID=2320862 RepID=A0A418WYH2_9BURK|nr:D-alanyl-D-alanine carboxypeptidase/D-alanyl-D-alanine-endopeptidase [Noviherbaspirillum cavernae]RJG05298.1 D-alanyl-D-alanine carboxypeptidase/D-alanyl-D-alanine-endopeptidase [Noviherbaspirillum cavernae]
MQILKRLTAACFLFVIAGAALAQNLPPVVSDALKKAEIPPYAIGVYVQQVDGGPVMTASNWGAPLSPASTMKLVTTGAALDILGPAFTWKTQAYADGRQAGEVLHGDLIIKGSGDPKLVVENLWLFLRRIRAQGIREIRGNLLLDRSAFEEAAYDPASFDNDPLKPYNAGPDALLLNYKALSFRFVPDQTAGLVRLTMEPPVDGFPVHSPSLANGECGDWRARLQPEFNGEGARFDGVFSTACGEKAWFIHPYQMTHAQYFGGVFRRIWAELGGTLTGEVRSGIVPPTARLVTEWQSPPLSEIIRDINKYSNNVMARQLLLTIGNQALQLPATPERGAAVVKRWLAKKRIEAPELAIDNGSGLSRTERISALTLGHLLAAAYQSPTMPEFIASMPLIGLDGTMRKRLTMQTVAGNGHIKTGTLEGVRAIAGYVLGASGKRYVVVFLINHRNAERGQQAQDALLQWVFERG